MNGVEVLNTIYEYESMIHPKWIAIFLLLALIVAILGVITVGCNVLQTILIGLEVCLIIGAIVSGIGSVIENDEIVDTKYQVIVSEEVDFNDFMEKYEVIDIDGEIYTVREKE